MFWIVVFTLLGYFFGNRLRDVYSRSFVGAMLGFVAGLVPLLLFTLSTQGEARVVESPLATMTDGVTALVMPENRARGGDNFVFFREGDETPAPVLISISNYEAEIIEPGQQQWIAITTTSCRVELDLADWLFTACTVPGMYRSTTAYKLYVNQSTVDRMFSLQFPD